MKKLFFILILIYGILNAKDNYELKLYENILPLFFKTDTIDVYVDSQTKDILKNSERFKVVLNCNDATLFIGKDFSHLSQACQEKPIFCTSYRSFKDNKNCFGAFYWRKGRPQIKFKLDVIKTYELQISEKLRKYAK